MDKILKGKTTIIWGTKGMTTGGLSTAIAEKISYKPKVEEPEIEEGDGHTVTEVYINNGFDAEATFLYDSAITWPTTGDEVLLKSPRFPAGKTCTVIAGDEELSRKQEGKITLRLKYRPWRG